MPNFNIGTLILTLMFATAVVASVLFIVWYNVKGTTFKLEAPITPTTELIIVDGKVDTLYVYKF